jgi:hypothetical protein
MTRHSWFLVLCTVVMCGLLGAIAFAFMISGLLGDSGFVLTNRMQKRAAVRQRLEGQSEDYEPEAWVMLSNGLCVRARLQNGSWVLVGVDEKFLAEWDNLHKARRKVR